MEFVLWLDAWKAISEALEEAASGQQCIDGKRNKDCEGFVST
jgi:hypothetical protein